MQVGVVTESLVGLLLAAIIVFRFAVRELKPRIVRRRAVWIRPVILVAGTAYLAWATAKVDPAGVGVMVAALVVGGAVGALTGGLIVRYTRFSSAGVPNAVRVEGSKVTFAIWIAAFVLRFLAR